MLSARILAVLCVLAVAACAQPPRVAPPPAPVLLDPNAACLQDLARMGASFQAMEPFSNDQGCGIDNPVQVSAAAIAWNRPATLGCQLARTVTRYEAELVQPLAMSILGQRVVRMHHAGTYDCRVRRNATTQAAARAGRKTAGRLSEHSQGKAIDVTAFELADGSVISVKQHWRAGDSRSEFLHRLARQSCGAFNVVLTPNHDRFHQDHFHLDIGPYTLCGY